MVIRSRRSGGRTNTNPVTRVGSAHPWRSVINRPSRGQHSVSRSNRAICIVRAQPTSFFVPPSPRVGAGPRCGAHLPRGQDAHPLVEPAKGTSVRHHDNAVAVDQERRRRASGGDRLDRAAFGDARRPDPRVIVVRDGARADDRPRGQITRPRSAISSSKP